MHAQINGGILIDKQPGFTSHDVVAQMRYILRTKRIGHTGTLDPFATGLMVVCLGQCTRLSQFLTDHDKSYLATIRFGFGTDTQDFTGKPLTDPKPPEGLTEVRLIEAVARFTGSILQTPPMFSAKKFEGIPLHQLARQGKVIVRTPSTVTIRQLQFLPNAEGRLLYVREDGLVEARFMVDCSAGTYIRTIAHDLGEYLGCGAHLTALRRLRVGDFSIANSVTIEKLIELVHSGQLDQCLLKPIDLIPGWPRVILTDEELSRFRHGQFLIRPCPEDASPEMDPLLGMCNASGALTGVGRYEHEASRIRPQIVFSE